MLVTSSNHCNNGYVGDIFQATVINDMLVTYSSHCNKRYVGDIFKPLQ